MPPSPLEVVWQTMHVVPTFGIQIWCETGKNGRSLEVKTISSFFAFTFLRKLDKNCSFFIANTFFDWSSHSFPKKPFLSP